MLVLALETATDRSSAALLENDDERALWHTETSGDLCRSLAPEIGALLRRASTPFGRLDLIAVGLGPGSFTSLRIGLATAKAIALAHDLPLVGVPSLAAIAWHARADHPGLLCPVLDARRGDLYAALYRASADAVEPLRPPAVASPDRLAAALITHREPVTVLGQLPPDQAQALASAAGDAVSILTDPILPEAAAVGRLARRRFDSRGPDDIASLRPIYVRMSYAEESFDIDLGLR